jgi:hypothetical protein
VQVCQKPVINLTLLELASANNDLATQVLNSCVVAENEEYEAQLMGTEQALYWRVLCTNLHAEAQVFSTICFCCVAEARFDS